MNMKKGASIQLFDYLQLKTKQGEDPIKVCHYVFSCVMASVELALNNKRNIQSSFLTHAYNSPHKEIQKQSCQLLILVSIDYEGENDDMEAVAFESELTNQELRKLICG